MSSSILANFSRNAPMEYFESVSSDPAPSASASSAPSMAKSDDVIFLDLKPALAFAKFSGSIFSASPPPSSLSSVPSSTFPPSSSSSSLFESPIDRFHRLKHEIQQFATELQQFQAFSPSTDGGVGALSSSLIGELSSLSSSLDVLIKEPALKTLLANEAELIDQIQTAEKELESEKAVTTTTNASNAAAKFSPSSSFLSLFSSFDRRLAALERTVGLGLGTAVAAQPKPVNGGAGGAKSTADSVIWSRVSSSFPDLHSGLLALHRRLALLEPAKLESINKSLKSIIADFEVMEQSKQEAGQSHQQISELYDLLGRWDAFAGQLPIIVARFQSLRAIHEQAAMALRKQQEIDESQEEIKRLLMKDQQLLEGLGKELAVNQKQIEANMGDINKRMDDIASKLQALK